MTAKNTDVVPLGGNWMALMGYKREALCVIVGRVYGYSCRAPDSKSKKFAQKKYCSL